MGENIEFGGNNIYQGNPSDFDGMNPETNGAKPEGGEDTQEQFGEVDLPKEKIDQIIDEIIKNAKKLDEYEDADSDSEQEDPGRENSEQEVDESKPNEGVNQKIAEGDLDQFDNIDEKNVEDEPEIEDIKKEKPQWTGEDVSKYFEKHPEKEKEFFEWMNEAERSAKERMGEIEDEIRKLEEQRKRIDEQIAEIDERIKDKQEEYEGAKKDEKREKLSAKMKNFGEGFVRQSKAIGGAIREVISKNKEKILVGAAIVVLGGVISFVLYSENVGNIQTKLNDLLHHPGEEITSISENDDDESEKEKQFEQIKVQIGDEEKDISLDFGDYKDNSVQHRLIDPTNTPEDVTIEDKRDEFALSASMFDVENAEDKFDEQVIEEGINGVISRLDEPVFGVSLANLYDDAGRFKIGDGYFSIDSSEKMTKFVLEEANKSEYIRSEFTDLIVKESIKKLAKKAPILKMRTIESNSHYIASCVEASIENGNLEDLKYYIDWDFRNSEDQKILQFFTEDGVNQLDINEIGSEKYNYLKAFGVFDGKTDSEAIELMRKVECVGLSLNTGQMVYMWKGDGGGNGGGVVTQVIDPVPPVPPVPPKPKPTPTPTPTPSTPTTPTSPEEIIGKGNVSVGDNFDRQGTTNVTEATQGNPIVTQESTGTSVNNNSPGASTGGAGEQSSEPGTQTILEGGNVGNDSNADQNSAGANNPDLTTNEAINIENDIANGN